MNGFHYNIIKGKRRENVFKDVKVRKEEEGRETKGK
jgi:hypothetical protein